MGELKIGTMVIKGLWLALVYACIAALAGFVIYQTFFAGRVATAKHDQQQVKAQGEVSKAQGNAGAAAANAVANQGVRERVIRETTNNNYRTITASPGAGDPVNDAVDAAGRRAICLRASAAGLSDCQRLQEANP